MATYIITRKQKKDAHNLAEAQAALSTFLAGRTVRNLSTASDEFQTDDEPLSVWLDLRDMLRRDFAFCLTFPRGSGIGAGAYPSSFHDRLRRIPRDNWDGFLTRLEEVLPSYDA